MAISMKFSVSKPDRVSFCDTEATKHEIQHSSAVGDHLLVGYVREHLPSSLKQIRDARSPEKAPSVKPSWFKHPLFMTKLG